MFLNVVGKTQSRSYQVSNTTSTYYKLHRVSKNIPDIIKVY